MLIINADDYGRNRLATDRTLGCHTLGTVTSASAMVFMEDSARAAALAQTNGLSTGLHLNFTEAFTAPPPNTRFLDCHNRIAGFLNCHNYAQIVYHPGLRQCFAYAFECQLEGYQRLYAGNPSHFDGHHHVHLCTNMILDGIVPRGMKVRRTFVYARGEKGWFNRMYRAAVARWQKRSYLTPDYLFSLLECLRNGQLNHVLDLARGSTVELETHPELPEEYEWLLGDAWGQALTGLRLGTYSQLVTVPRRHEV